MWCLRALLPFFWSPRRIERHEGSSFFFSINSSSYFITALIVSFRHMRRLNLNTHMHLHAHTPLKQPPPISRCRSLCPLREVWVQAVLGSCNADKGMIFNRHAFRSCSTEFPELFAWCMCLFAAVSVCARLHTHKHTHTHTHTHIDIYVHIVMNA